MYINLETDYAIRIIDCLVKAGSRVEAKTISEKTAVPLRFSLKILRKLVSAGLAQSYKGARGGYELAKKPEEITLLEVIENIQGLYRVSRCVGGDYVCGRMMDYCPYHEVFEESTEYLRNNLRTITFADQQVRKQKVKV